MGAEYQQMPNRSAVSRIDRIYSIGFSNSAALGWNMGASRSSCARKGAGQELAIEWPSVAVGGRRCSRGLTGLASSLFRARFDGIVAFAARDGGCKSWGRQRKNTGEMDKIR